MMNRTFFALAAAAVAVSAAPASAFEPPIGSRLGERLKPSVNSGTNETRTAFRFAECQANKHRDKVRDILDAPNTDRVARARMALEHEESCYLDVVVDQQVERVRMLMADSAYRGMLAEGVLKAGNRADGLQPLPLQPTYERPWTALTGRPPAVDEMAICIADVDPAGIRIILKALPESRDERVAFSTISESMGKCLQSGVELKADAIALRTAFAEALYHRAYDDPATAVADATGVPN